MQWFYLFGFLLLGSILCKADEDTDLQDITKDKEDSSEEDAFIEIKEFFEKKCKDVGGDDALKNLHTVVGEVKACIASHVPTDFAAQKNITGGKDESDDICSEKRKVIIKCFDGLVDLWEDCSVPEEKYVAEFASEAIDSVFDYICANEGEVFSSLFNKNTFECGFTLLNQTKNFTDECQSNLKVLMSDTPEAVVIKKSELCHDLNLAKRCLTTFIHESCPEDTALVPAIAGLFEAIGSPCDKRRRRDIFKMSFY